MGDRFRADVDALKNFGADHFPDLAEEFSSASKNIGQLDLQPSVFGDGCDVGGAVAADYTQVQRGLSDATKQLGKTLDEIGLALVLIARNYTLIDEHYGG